MLCHLWSFFMFFVDGFFIFEAFLRQLSVKFGPSVLGRRDGSIRASRKRRSRNKTDNWPLPKPGWATTTATATTATTAVEARKGKRQAMEVTPEASRRIKALLDARQKEYLKIGVKTRGCNGMTYTMNYADESERKKFDELVTTEDGVKIIVEPNALMSIIGTKMDYVSDRLRSEFVFENPNSKAQCGCGESFTV